MTTLIRILLLAIAFVVLERLGMFLALGAHPFWSSKATYIGIIAGTLITLCVAFLDRRAPITAAKLLIGIVLTTAAIAAITLLYGKAEFAASYAENAFAGRVWYFGFMAMIAGLFVFAAAVADALIRLRKSKPQ